MKLTLKDIADKVNVSVSTVSRVLNNVSTSLPPETKEEIFRVSKEMGYQITIDRKKGRNKEKKICCILNNLRGKYQDPYFSEIIYGIERELLDEGSTLNFTYDKQDLQNNELFESFRDYKLGIIVVGHVKKDFLEKLLLQTPYIISVGGNPELSIDYVTVDFFNAAENAVQYLINLGHKKIGCISGSSFDLEATEREDRRYLGYESKIVNHQLPLTPDWIQDGQFTIEGGYSAMKKILLLENRPTAMFVASDQMAQGAYRAVQEEGLKIPQDISIVSFDDIEVSRFTNPPLTTIRVYKEEMGRIAVKMLLQRLEGSIKLPLKTYLPTELIVRESSRQLT